MHKGDRGGDRWSFVIGDVMGKGVPAGLIMTMTRGMLRAEVLNNHSPSKILEHLNEVMYEDLEKSHRFVTMFYSEYDPQTQILSFSNAAHTPALHWRAKSRSIHALDTMGALIGLEAGSKYEESSTRLNAGDVVIYYTDGFTEAASPEGDRFDEENLRKALDWACQNCFPLSDDVTRPQMILDYIFQEVQNFIGEGHTHTDDITLVVLQIKDKPVNG
jgi:sigma-B regulation protein RsbU (phosphoserine phosphatase)